MADQAELIFAYKYNAEDLDFEFELGETYDAVKEKINNAGGDEKAETPPAVVQKSKSSFDADDISVMQGRFINHILSFKSLITLTVPMRYVLHAGSVKRDLFDVAEKEYEYMEDYDGYRVFSIRPDQLDNFDRAIEKVGDIARGVSVLPGSNLLSLVATFDSFIADLAFRAVRTKPGLYGEDRKISLKDIMSMSSFDEVVDHVAMQDVQDCMRGSHAAQIKFIESVCDTKIAGEYERWNEFIEIFERRNLVAHQNLEVNKIYLTNCAEVGYDVSSLNVGDNLKLDMSYLYNAVDILLEFGVLLHYVIWKKRHKKEAVGAYEKLNLIAYNLIKSKNERPAQRILHFALNKQPRIGPDVIVKMMTINLANCYKKMNDNDKMIATIKSIDWSGSADRFKICIAALNEDVNKVATIMPKVVDDEEVGADGFRSWPVFDTVRADQVFQDAFKANFGEPVVRASREVEKVDNVAGLLETHEGTAH